MSRTIQQIYDEIITEKETFSSLNALVPNPDTAQTFLTNLTSSSKVAFWRLMFWVMAVAIWSHEQIFDLHLAEVEARGDELITGTKRWYRDQVLKFQYGDALIWDSTNLKYGYAVGSTGTKIVSNASVLEVGAQLRIKIAKDDGAGGLEPLDVTEETAFTTYINKIKFAGTNISITNINADFLKIVLNIDYDPLTLSSTGELIATPGTFPVIDAVNGYITGLPFDGVFNLTKFIDNIQSATGVVDAYLTSSQAKSGAGTYAPTGQNYTANAGYLQIDPSFPLTDPTVIIYNPITL
jgi:hypothetical protein